MISNYKSDSNSFEKDHILDMLLEYLGLKAVRKLDGTLQLSLIDPTKSLDGKTDIKISRDPMRRT